MTGSPIDALASAYYSALIKDLPDVEYQYRAPGTRKPGDPTEKRKRRPYGHEVEVAQFLQGWSSTALGFGGVGGQAFTDAYTTVVHTLGHAAVYFGGRFAYLVPFNRTLMDDIRNHCMAEVCDAGKYRKKAPVEDT